MLQLGSQGVGEAFDNGVILIQDDAQCIQILQESGHYVDLHDAAVSNQSKNWFLALFKYQGYSMFVIFDRGHVAPTNNGWTIIASPPSEEEKVRRFIAEYTSEDVKNIEVEEIRTNESVN